MAVNNTELHKVLEPFFQAAKESDYNVEILPLDMNPFEIPPKFIGRWRVLIEKIIFIYSHIIFAFKSVPICLKNDLIIVREFLTIPLLFTWPVFFIYRRKLLFIVNHNVQFIVHNSMQRCAFWLLAKLGMRYVFLESPAGSELALSRKVIDDCLILPIPAKSIEINIKADSHDEKKESIVGIIGDFREEKGNRELLNYLYEISQLPSTSWKLIIGTNDSQVHSWCADREITVIDTTESSGYFRAYHACDVVVLNYRESAYFYRSSGAICDAISFGTTVLCPDYPVLRQQLSAHGIIGEVFVEQGEILGKINQILLRKDYYSKGFETQLKERSVASIKDKIDLFIKEKRM